jgi:hypothetical protein
MCPQRQTTKYEDCEEPDTLLSALIVGDEAPAKQSPNGAQG